MTTQSVLLVRLQFTLPLVMSQSTQLLAIPRYTPLLARLQSTLLLATNLFTLPLLVTSQCTLLHARPQSILPHVRPQCTLLHARLLILPTSRVSQSTPQRTAPAHTQSQIPILVVPPSFRVLSSLSLSSLLLLSWHKHPYLF